MSNARKCFYIPTDSFVEGKGFVLRLPRAVVYLTTSFRVARKAVAKGSDSYPYGTVIRELTRWSVTAPEVTA